MSRLDPQFDAWIQRHRAIDAATVDAARRGAPRPYVTLPGPAWPSQIAAGFDRTAINLAYEQATADAQNPGTVGEVQALQLQGDLLADAERGTRAGQATATRALALALARRRGHAHEAGLWAQWRGAALDAIAEGAGA